MWIFPAIDLMNGCAVRLVRGDYAQKTVYSREPAQVAKGFSDAGARYVHVVDLDGAKSGATDNFLTVQNIVRQSGLRVEIGGGVRSMDTVRRYMDAGVWRVILGTAAVDDPDFLQEAVERFAEKIAVGVDVRDGRVMTRGWLADGGVECDAFCEKLQNLGVRTVICTDISRDGMMDGTNTSLYAHLAARFPRLQLVASGGVSSYDDIEALRKLELYGAIVGKALYTGAIDLARAVAMTREAKR